MCYKWHSIFRDGRAQKTWHKVNIITCSCQNNNNRPLSLWTYLNYLLKKGTSLPVMTQARKQQSEDEIRTRSVIPKLNKLTGWTSRRLFPKQTPTGLYSFYRGRFRGCEISCENLLLLGFPQIFLNGVLSFPWKPPRSSIKVSLLWSARDEVLSLSELSRLDSILNLAVRVDRKAIPSR